MSLPAPLLHFRALVAALSVRLNVPLDPGDGMLVLVDDSGGLRMVIELSADLNSLFVVLPVIPFPDDEKRLGELALEVLLLNADRHALSDASLCGDAHRSEFCLVKRLMLDIAPASFLEELDSLSSLAGMVSEYLLEREADTSYTGSGFAALSKV